MFSDRSFLADAIKAVQEDLGRRPGRLYDSEEPAFHFGGRSFPETDHIFHLRDTEPGNSPGTGHYPESFHREIYGGLIGAVIMPVADHYVPGDQVDSPVGIVITCFPLADPRSLAINQPVSPDP